MSNSKFENAAYDQGIDVARMRQNAPVSGNPTVTATTTKAGVVLNGGTIANLIAAPTMADFNNLLAVLRTAGVIS